MDVEIVQMRLHAASSKGYWMNALVSPSIQLIVPFFGFPSCGMQARPRGLRGTVRPLPSACSSGNQTSTSLQQTRGKSDPYSPSIHKIRCTRTRLIHLHISSLPFLPPFSYEQARQPGVGSLQPAGGRAASPVGASGLAHHGLCPQRRSRRLHAPRPPHPPRTPSNRNRTGTSYTTVHIHQGSIFNQALRRSEQEPLTPSGAVYVPSCHCSLAGICPGFTRASQTWPPAAAWKYDERCEPRCERRCHRSY